MLPVTALPATQLPRSESSPSSASSSSTRSPNVRMIVSLAGPTPLIRTAPSLPVADRVAAQPGGDLPDQHRVLGPLVLGVGERERQQLLLAELRQRPVERAHRLVPG